MISIGRWISIWTVACGIAVAGCDDYELVQSGTVYLNTRLGQPAGGNTAKLFDVALDTTRNKLYAHGIISPYVAVIDTTSGSVDKYIDSGIDEYHISYMAVRSASGRLFIADQLTNKLYKMNPETGHLSDVEVALGAEPSRIEVFDSLGYVFVSFTGPDRIRVYSSEDLSLVRELGASDGIYAPKAMRV